MKYGYEKLDWLAEHGGMVLLLTHPDYMAVGDGPGQCWDYPAEFYVTLLEYIKGRYAGKYWHALPRDVARFWTSLPDKENDYIAWANNGVFRRRGILRLRTRTAPPSLEETGKDNS